VGRVVTHVGGQFDTKLSVIVEIIDHKRVRLHPGESAGGILEDIGGMREGKPAGIEVNMNTTGPR
jgi:hypothetical protein